MSDDLDSPALTGIAIGLFAAIFVLIGWDLLADYSRGTNLGHVIVELAVLAVAACGIGLLWWRFRRAQKTVRSLRVDLEAARGEALRWKEESRELIQGLSRAIEQQFGRWSLTGAEAEVGLLLLKGLSHKEIAILRQTSERTVREQARALYRKAGLSGRSALSAFFLEDLLLPRQATEPGRPAPD
jgi:DNA-binding CsgD family transcriptional regulator